MIDRQELKRRAKLELKKSFWQGYLLVFAKNFISSTIRMLVTFIISLFGFGVVFRLASATLGQMLTVRSQDEMLSALLTSIQLSKYTFFINFFQMGVLIVCQLLVFNQLRTGVNLWFSRNRESVQAPRFSLLFYNFSAKGYGGIFRGMAWRDFWLGLWRLPNFIIVNLITYGVLVFSEKLLRIYQNIYSSRQLEGLVEQLVLPRLLPLILGGCLLALICLAFAILAGVKSYAYRTTEWILADNPNIDYRRALKISREMVKGYKWQWFVLDLSFIGWYALFILLLPFYFFTRPLLESYVTACSAEFYSQIRDRYVAAGNLSMEDLGFVKLDGSSAC